MDWFDSTLYPEEANIHPPSTLAERIDFIARLCGAWDFGILPRAETIAEIRGDSWRAAVEECRMPTSISYHLLREWHGLSVMEFLGSVPPEIENDPNIRHV